MKPGDEVIVKGEPAGRHGIIIGYITERDVRTHWVVNLRGDEHGLNITCADELLEVRYEAERAELQAKIRARVLAIVDRLKFPAELMERLLLPLQFTSYAELLTADERTFARLQQSANTIHTLQTQAMKHLKN